MAIPLNGNNSLRSGLKTWSTQMECEASSHAPEPGEIIVASGKLYCNKYNTEVLASECAACGECLSPIALNKGLGEYTVKCSYELNDATTADTITTEVAEEEKENPIETVINNMHSQSPDGEYDWEAEKIAEIEGVIGDVEEDAWEEVKPASKLQSPKDLSVQLLGSSSVIRVPSAHTDGLGDRAAVSNDQVSIFDTTDTIKSKIDTAAKTEETIQEAQLQKAEEQLNKSKQWQEDYLGRLGETAEDFEDLNSIKRIANEEHIPHKQSVPTGKTSMFEGIPNITEESTEVADTAQDRASKKSDEWSKRQDEAVDERDDIVAQLEEGNMAQQGIHRIGEDIGSSNNFENAADDRLSIFDVDKFERKSQEETVEEKLASSREAQKKAVGVRETTEDRSWDNYENQRAQSAKSVVMDEFLSQVAKKDGKSMEEFLTESSKTNTTPDRSSGEGQGFRRVE